MRSFEAAYVKCVERLFGFERVTQMLCDLGLPAFNTSQITVQHGSAYTVVRAASYFYGEGKIGVSEIQKP